MAEDGVTFEAARAQPVAKGKGRLVDDPELVAMYQMDDLLRGLPQRAQERALAWLCHRYRYAEPRPQEG